MKSVNPYLNFDGKTEEAFDFYRAAFGGEFKEVIRYDSMPPQHSVPEHLQKRILHISLPLSSGLLLMGSDTMEGMGPPLKNGNNQYICINTESKEESDKLFEKLSQDGEIEMKMENTFWDAYFGSFQDKFGVKWMINFDKTGSLN